MIRSKGSVLGKFQTNITQYLGLPSHWRAGCNLHDQSLLFVVCFKHWFCFYDHDWWQTLWLKHVVCFQPPGRRSSCGFITSLPPSSPSHHGFYRSWLSLHVSQSWFASFMNDFLSYVFPRNHGFHHSWHPQVLFSAAPWLLPCPHCSPGDSLPLPGKDGIVGMAMILIKINMISHRILV